MRHRDKRFGPGPLGAPCGGAKCCGGEPACQGAVTGGVGAGAHLGDGLVERRGGGSGQLAGALIPLGGALGHRLGDHVVDRRQQRRHQLGDPRWRLRQVRGGHPGHPPYLENGAFWVSNRNSEQPSE